MRLLLWDGLRPVAIGLTAGAGIALLTSRLLACILFGVGTRDPLAFSIASGVLLASAAAAVFIPARRAARMDPAFVPPHSCRRASIGSTRDARHAGT